MPDFENLKKQALEQFAQKKYSEAVATLQQAIEVNPEDAKVHHYLGAAYFLMDDYKRSEESLKKAMQLDEKNAEVIFDLSLVYSKQDKHAEAAYLLKEALSLEPENVDFMAYQGKELLLDKKTQEATPLLKQALEKNPDHNVANHFLGKCQFESGLYSEAIESFKKARQSDTQDASLYYDMALTHLQLNEKGAAMRFKQMLALLDVNLANQLDHEIRSHSGAQDPAPQTVSN